MEESLKHIATFIENNPLLWFVGFLCWFVFVIFIISRFGWRKFSNKYGYTSSSALSRIGLISAKVGKANYSNCIILSANDTGFEMKAVLLFRIGHPRFFIPFKDIKNIENKKTFGQKIVIMSFKDENLPTLTFQERTFNKIKPNISA